MTNFSPIRPTQKLPEYGDCLFALQTNPVYKGGRGALLESLHTGPIQPGYATDSSHTLFEHNVTHFYLNTRPIKFAFSWLTRIYVCAYALGLLRALHDWIIITFWNLTWRPPSWIFKTWFLSNGSPWANDFQSLYQIWRNNVERRRNYGEKSKSKMAAVRHLGFSKIWFLRTRTPWAAHFPSWYKIWCKNVDRGRNYGRKSKSKMAAVRHLEFSKVVWKPRLSGL